MKSIVCPPCGTVLKAESDDELVRIVQAHASENHGYAPSREDILRHAKEMDR